MPKFVLYSSENKVYHAFGYDEHVLSIIFYLDIGMILQILCCIFMRSREMGSTKQNSSGLFLNMLYQVPITLHEACPTT